MARKDDYKWIAKAAQAWTIPGTFFFAILIGFLAGSWLDEKLGTDPWLMMLFVLLGIGAGFYEAIRIALRITK